MSPPSEWLSTSAECRPARASVSEGYPQTHQLEQARVLEDALEGREMTFA